MVNLFVKGKDSPVSSDDCGVLNKRCNLSCLDKVCAMRRVVIIPVTLF